MDKLTTTGVRFVNALTPTGICSPARTSIESGLFAHKHGIIFNSGPQKRWAGGDNNVSPDIEFFSQRLAKRGWQLAHIGKWHIGMKNKPSDYGYKGIYYSLYEYPAKHEHYLDYIHKYDQHDFKILEQIKDPSGARSHCGLQQGPEEVSTPHYVADQAIEMIQKFSAHSKPFFVSCNFWGPHAPYYITKEHYYMYKDARIKPWPNRNSDLSDKPVIINRYGQY